MEFATLRTFLAVVDAGSFAEASATTGLSRMTLARRVTALEGHLRQTLIVRGAGGVTATPAGLALHRDGRRLVDDYLATLRSMRERPGAPTLLAAPSELLPTIAGSLLPRWRGTGPLRLLEDPEPLRSVTRGRLAAVARAHPPDRLGRAIHCADLDLVLGASEGYVSRHGGLATIADLAAHRIVAASDAPSWPTRSGGRLSVRPTHVVQNEAEVALAVRAGTGLGLVSRAPGLVVVLTELIGTTAPIWLVGDPTGLAEFEVEGHA